MLTAWARFYIISSLSKTKTYLIFFVFYIKQGKTKSKIVTLIATTHKALLSIAKANGRLSGRKFYAGNIYHLFGKIFTHTFASSAYKKVRSKRNAPKKCIPLIVATQMPDRWRYEEREKTLFTKVFSLQRLNICNLCSMYIIPLFCRFVNTAWKIDKIVTALVSLLSQCLSRKEDRERKSILCPLPVGAIFYWA